jgi:hypothetical protein
VLKSFRIHVILNIFNLHKFLIIIVFKNCLIIFFNRFLAFNEKTENYILFNLDSNRMFHMTTQIFYSTILLITLPFQLYPVMKMCDKLVAHHLKKNIPNSKYSINIRERRKSQINLGS